MSKKYSGYEGPFSLKLDNIDKLIKNAENTEQDILRQFRELNGNKKDKGHQQYNEKWKEELKNYILNFNNDEALKGDSKLTDENFQDIENKLIEKFGRYFHTNKGEFYNGIKEKISKTTSEDKEISNRLKNGLKQEIIRTYNEVFNRKNINGTLIQPEEIFITYEFKGDGVIFPEGSEDIVIKYPKSATHETRKPIRYEVKNYVPHHHISTTPTKKNISYDKAALEPIDDEGNYRVKLYIDSIAMEDIIAEIIKSKYVSVKIDTNKYSNQYPIIVDNSGHVILFSEYLQYLKEDTLYIDVRNLQKDLNELKKNIGNYLTTYASIGLIKPYLYADSNKEWKTKMTFPSKVSLWYINDKH